MTRDGRWLPDVDGYAVRLQDGLVAFFPLAEDAPHYMRRDVEPTVLSVKAIREVQSAINSHTMRSWKHTRGSLKLTPMLCTSIAPDNDSTCARERGHRGNHYDFQRMGEWESR